MTNRHHHLQSSPEQGQDQDQNPNQDKNQNQSLTTHNETPDHKRTKICGPFHGPSLPHLPRFRRHHRTPAVKSLPDASLTRPASPPDNNPQSPSRCLFPSGWVPCLEIPPPAPATTASPRPQPPASTNPTSPPIPASPASRTSPASPAPTAAASTTSLPASPTTAMSAESPSPPPPDRLPLAMTRPSLLQPPRKRTWRNVRIFRFFCSPFRSLPIIAPSHCKFPSHKGGMYDGHIHGGIRMTGTLFGHRKARVTLAIQENPRCLPMLLLEMAIPTGKLLQEMASGLVRIALECDKRAGCKMKLTEEPVWTMYCNGRKTGYGSRREATDDDLHIMQLLHAVSMGAGVLPNKDEGEHPDGELTYMRAFYERVIGSKDSETFYMLNPDSNNGPELSIFFVRI